VRRVWDMNRTGFPIGIAAKTSQPVTNTLHTYNLEYRQKAKDAHKLYEKDVDLESDFSVRSLDL